jgi:hypothetical protein
MKKLSKKNYAKKVFLLTDICMWEKNKQEGTHAPHAVQAIDVKTGQSFFINSGSRIRFVDGEITEPLSQDEYNKRS